MDLTQLAQIIPTVGAALTQEQQLFVSAHWRELLPWLKTDLGKLALATFVADWQQAAQPPLPTAPK